MNEQKSFVNDADKIIPAVNDSPYKRILAIGDVHAAYDELLSLWKKLAVTDEDLVIFLGDYLYGLGDKNLETLHWILEHRKQKNIIFLRGNVDETYLHHLFDKHGKIFPWRNKGVALDIKTAAIREPFLPREILDFLTNLPNFHCETVGGKKYFFCHAGVKVDTPLEEQTKEYLTNHPELESFYENYSGEAVIVVGHKSPKKMRARIPRLFKSCSRNIDADKPLKVPNRNILMLDTNAKEGSFLSCVDVISGEFWQSGKSVTAAPIESIIFVCSGNSCRSPMAKYIMRQMLAEKNPANKIFVDSAGCHTRGGGRMSNGARKILTEDKIPFDRHVSKPFTRQEYRKFDLVIALDEDILRAAKKISGGDPDKKIRLFTDFDGRNLSVEDPYITDDYRKACETVKLGCAALIEAKF